MYQKWTISVCVCAVLQNYYTGFDKGVCSACTSREKVPPMLMEYMKLMHLVLVYGGWTKNRCMEVKLSLHALNSYSLVATKLGMLL